MVVLRCAQNLSATTTGMFESKYLNQYYVYVMSNRSRTLYAGITNILVKRVWEHKQKMVEGFTKKYNITMLVYYEVTNDVHAAIGREKQIKGWLRSKKLALVESMNPGWKDLSEGWYETPTGPLSRHYKTKLDMT